MATNINYDDERFTQVESDKREALTEVENAYGGMKEQADGFYQAQIDASKDWANQQQQLQQEQTDFAIEQINQQKEQAQKDYTKEQSGAYVDWQKQSNQYGANAEQMAASGLQGTGFSESSQVSMYNTYQSRVATARQTYSQAVLNYENAIKDAQLQNNAALADIAYNALQQQLQLSLEQFQYGNQLVLDLLNQKQQVDDRYYSRWQDVQNQINTENAMAEQIRQHNEQMALEREQFQTSKEQWQSEFDYNKERAEVADAQWQKEYDYTKERDAVADAQWQKEYETSKEQWERQFAESVRQYNEGMAFDREKFEESKRQYDQSYQLQVDQFDESIRQWKAEMQRLKENDEKSYKIEIQQLQLQIDAAEREKEKMAEDKRQFDLQYQESVRQFNLEYAEEQRQFNEELALAKKNSSSSGSSSSSSSSNNQNASINKSNNTSGTTKQTTLNNAVTSPSARVEYKNYTSAQNKTSSTKSSSSTNKSSTTTKTTTSKPERRPGETMTEYIQRLKASGYSV